LRCVSVDQHRSELCSHAVRSDVVQRVQLRGGQRDDDMGVSARSLEEDQVALGNSSFRLGS